MTVDREPQGKRVIKPTAPTGPTQWDLLRLKDWQRYQDSQNQPHRDPIQGNTWGPQPPKTPNTA